MFKFFSGLLDICQNNLVISYKDDVSVNVGECWAKNVRRDACKRDRDDRLYRMHFTSNYPYPIHSLISDIVPLIAINNTWILSATYMHNIYKHIDQEKTLQYKRQQRQPLSRSTSKLHTFGEHDLT